jgi:hypothetical protein
MGRVARDRRPLRRVHRVGVAGEQPQTVRIRGEYALKFELGPCVIEKAASFFAVWYDSRSDGRYQATL